MNFELLESKPASSASLLKRKPIFDVFINDAPFNSSLVVGGARIFHEGYKAWVHMLHRCYGKSAEKYQTYQGVQVCHEWRSFMSFRDWWVDNYVEEWCLDKDTIGAGDVYSPDTCIYIPQGVNKLLNTCAVRRGAQPIGVTEYKGRFRAAVSNPVNGLHEWLGDYRTSAEAHDAWRKRKLEIVEGLKPTLDRIDPRLYPAIKDKVAAMR